jgi:hypothetical protein
MERRRHERSFGILPIRYKEKDEWIYMVGEIIDLTDNGFCIIMPVDLEVNKEFEFEVFKGGKSIKGSAQVEWMDKGHMKAGCSYTYHNFTQNL